MRRHWSKQKCARLGWLHGRGLAPAAIAVDMILNTTEETVRRRIVALGLPTAAPVRTVVTFSVARQVYETIEIAAVVRGVSVDQLLRKITEILGEEPTLVTNILEG